MDGERSSPQTYSRTLTNLAGQVYVARMREGWVSMRGPDGTDGLHVKVRQDDEGRWSITDLYLHGGEISGETLRAIRMPQVEAGAYNQIIRSGPDADPAEAGWDDGVTIGQIRGVAPALHRKRRTRKPLARPAGDDPERFYAQVAAAYREHQETTSAPAKAIAEEAGVPVTTAHRWVREARIRGHLPRGRKGRVG